MVCSRLSGHAMSDGGEEVAEIHRARRSRRYTGHHHLGIPAGPTSTQPRIPSPKQKDRVWSCLASPQELHKCFAVLPNSPEDFPSSHPTMCWLRHKSCTSLDVQTVVATKGPLGYLDRPLWENIFGHAIFSPVREVCLPAAQ